MIMTSNRNQTFDCFVGIDIINFVEYFSKHYRRNSVFIVIFKKIIKGNKTYNFLSKGQGQPFERKGVRHGTVVPHQTGSNHIT